ncbi:MAG: SDR family NAD(P)-dependent oxidoreductase, partial [Verrucomicrobiota bacterium]
MARLDAHFRTAFVTGVSSGLGRAITEMLLADGVRVWGTAPRGVVIAAFRHPGFTAVELDLENPAAARAAAGTAEAEAGGCFDLAVLNAGRG